MHLPAKILWAAAALTLALWQGPALARPVSQCPPDDPNCIPKRLGKPSPAPVKKKATPIKPQTPLKPPAPAKPARPMPPRAPEKGTIFFTLIFSRRKIENLQEKIRRASRFSFDVTRTADLATQINNSRNLKVRLDSLKNVRVWSANPGADELVVTLLLTNKPTP